VKFAELDQGVPPRAVANNPYSWSAWHPTKMGVTSAWDTSVGTGVTIAIPDSGVDAKHLDLPEEMTSGWNFYHDTPDTSDVFPGD
jgi:thermitase